MYQRLLAAGCLSIGFAALTIADDVPVAIDTISSEDLATDLDDISRLPGVYVNARKWQELTLRVPQSVSVVSGDLVADGGLRAINDISTYVPNLRFTEFSSRRLSFPYIRGIGSGQGDPAVATYIDGVPQLGIGSTNIPLLDVERVEVLRGPQGTLYGRNAIGGLIHVYSKRPSNTTEFGIDGTIGNYDLFETRVRYSTPIKEDELFLSLAGQFQSRDGYTDNDFTGNDVDDREAYFGRAQVLWTPDASNEIRFTIYGETADDGGFVLSDIEGLKDRSHHIFQDFEGIADRDIVAPSLTWTHTGDSIDFTSISAYQTSDVDETSDFDFSALDGVRRRTEDDLDAFTQEIRFSSSEDAPIVLGDNAELKWLAGALYFSSDGERSAANDFRPGGVGILFATPGLDTTSGDFDDYGIGIFGQATVTFNDNFDVSAGLRYDYENKDADLRRTFESGGFTLLDTSMDVDDSYDEFVPRFSVAYRPNDTTTLYGLAAKGFKAGGFNLDAPAGEIAFDPETSWTYEGGVKMSMYDGDVLFNAAAFYIDWDDMQLSQFDAMVGGYVTNAGESTSQGIELELIAKPVDELEVFATFGYTDTEYDEFIDPFGMDVSDNDLTFAPETTFSVGAQYSADLGNDLAWYARGEYAYVGKFYYDPGNLEDESYGLANFRAGIGGTNWRLEGWIRNAFDEEFIPVAFQPSPADPTLFVGESGVPRTYGVTLTLTF